MNDNLNESESPRRIRAWFTHPVLIGALAGVVLGVVVAFGMPSHWLVIPQEPASADAGDNVGRGKGEGKVFYA